MQANGGPVSPDLVGNSNSGINPVLYNQKGGITLYLNEQGESVTLAENTRYTHNMLANYGVETRDSDGNLQGGMTLGGHFRALADWLGFDGTFGLDGTYAKGGEGSGAPGASAGGPKTGTATQGDKPSETSGGIRKSNSGGNQDGGLKSDSGNSSGTKSANKSVIEQTKIRRCLFHFSGCNSMVSSRKISTSLR